MAEKNRGGRPRLAEPLTETICTKLSKREAEAVQAFLDGMGLDRSAGLRALVLMAVDGRGRRPVRERRGGAPTAAEFVRERAEDARDVPVPPPVVFRPLPPGMEPEMAE